MRKYLIYFLIILVNHITIKDFDELERLEYKKVFKKIWQAKII